MKIARSISICLMLGLTLLWWGLKEAGASSFLYFE